MTNIKEEKLENVPYIYIGGSTLTTRPKVRMCFKGSGIKEIAKRIDDEDTLVYTEWSDYNDECESVKHYSKWSVIKHKRNSKTN